MGESPCKMPTSPKRTMTDVAPPKATTARCSLPRLPVIKVSIVAAPINARLAMKIGAESLASAPRLTSGSAAWCGTISGFLSLDLTASLIRKKDSRNGNPGERRRLRKTPQTFGVDIPQVESTFGLLCRGFYAELLRKRGFMRRKNEGVPRGLKCYQKNYFS